MKNHRRNRALSRSISSLVILSTAISAAQAANIWDGGGADNLWSTVTNWDDDAFPSYGTLTFNGGTQTTNVVDANINMNQLLWTGTSPWTLNNANSAAISLFDFGGTQAAKVENQSTGLVTVNAPITFAATAGPAWGEINAVNGGLTFGSAGALTVNGSIVAGIKMFGSGQTTTFNNTVSAAGKWFATTGASAATVEVGGAFTSGDIYAMNGSTLKLNSGGSITTSGLRLGGDFGTTLTQNLALGATFALTSATGGQTFGSVINTVTGNTSNALMVDSQNTSGTNTLSGNIFLDSPLRMQVAAGGTLAATGVISNASGITKQGNGTLTLSGVNTFTGGTTLAAGTLNLGNAAALGGGALTVSGNSTLDNTSGAAIATPAAKALNLNADLNVTGTNNISFNGGTLALGGAAGNRTLAVNANTMTVNNITAAAGVNLTKTGAGTLLLSSTVNNSTNTAATLDIQGGKIQVLADVTMGGLTGSGTYELGGAASKWMFVNNAAANTFSGSIQTVPGIRLGLVKSAGGTLTLSGTNTISDNFNVQNGTVVISGTTTTGFATGGQATIGSVANNNAVLVVSGGTLNATKPTNPSFALAQGANTRGFLSMSSGTINSTAQVNIGNGSGAVGTRGFSAASISGGTLNSGSWLVVGANFDRAVLNQSGGTINVNANRVTIGAGGNESHGVVNLSGGAFNVAAGANTGVFLGENGRGIMTLSGTAAMTLNTNGGATSGTMQFGGNATSIEGHLNLNGGTLTAFGVTKGNSTAGAVYRANFNGGTLRANANNAAFFNSLANTTAYVNAGGAIVDSNGFNVTVAQPLLAPAGSGVSAIAVTAGGAGYIDTPHVVLSGGTGTGATAVANVSGGAITGFTITNPGTGYAPTDVLTATVFGGGAATAATVGAISLAANPTSGGLTKNGAGTLTIGSTTSTYGGATTVNAGTLSIPSIGNAGAAGSLGASSNAAANLVLNGATLEFTGATGSTDRSFTIGTGTTGTISVSNPLGVLSTSGASAATNGNLTKTGAGVLSVTGANLHTGTTTVTAGVLGAQGSLLGPVVASGGQLNAVYNAVGTLSVPTLTLSGGGVNFDFSGTNDVVTVSSVGGLTLGSNSPLNLFQAGGTTAFTTNGTYALFDYDTSFNGSLDGSFIVANSQPGKVYSIANNTGATTIDLTIGDAVVSAWAVDADGNWSAGSNWTNGSPNSVGATANFTSAITAARAVTVAGPQTVGNIVFDNANSYALTGTATDIITLNNGIGAAQVSAVTGSHSLNAPLSLVNASTLNAGTGATLTVGGDISGAVGMTKTGNGTVALTGTNSYTTTNVTAGTLQIGAGGTTGTLGSSAVTVGVGATLTFNRSNAFTVSNSISGAGTLSQLGGGATTYTGTATYTGATNVTSGSLINEGVINGSTALNVNGASFTTQASGTTTIAGPTSVGATANGTLSLLGGASTTLNGLVGIGTGGSGITGALTVNTTGTLATNGIVNVGVGTGANGSFTMTAGTVNQTGATNVVIGANGGSGTFSMTGGTINTGTANPGFGVAIGSQGSTGTATITGGTINAPGEVWIGNNNTAGVTPTNNGSMSMSAGALNAGSWFVVGRNTATGTLNLSGGTITKGGAAGNFIIIGSLGGNGTVTQTGGALNATAGGIRLGENTGNTPAVALWDMQGGTSTVNGEINVGWRSSEATWNIGGTSVVNATGRLIVGAETTTATANSGAVVNGASVGTVNMTGGTVTFAGGDSRIGGDNSAVSVGSTGTVIVTGGTMNFGGNVQVGAYGVGTMAIVDGAVNSTSGFPVAGRFAGSNGNITVGGNGAFNQTGAAQGLIIGEEGTGTLNIQGGLVDVQGTTGLRIGHAATGNGTVNLDGGTLAAKYVQKSVAGSTAAFKFNGGVLKTTADAADFFIGVPATSISVEPGGANINTDGHAVTITQGLAPGIASTGGLTKSGNGTLTLSGTSTYVGDTLVNGGTLSITGSLSGSVTVETSATLSGTGTVGAVTANAGSTVAPGLSPGQLNTASVSLNTGSTLSLEVNGTSAGSFDVLNVTGGVTLAGNLAISGTYLTTPSVTNDLFFAIINDGADAISGTFAGLPDGSHVYAANGQDFIVSYFGDSVGGTITGGNDFVLQAVPEPGSATLLLGGLALLAGRRRRKA